jgi:HEAT repeat protein
LPHVFVSYVRNNKRKAQRLCNDLAKYGVEVWLDRNNISPGVDWHQAIQRAIQSGGFFIACFSRQYEQRSKRREKTYMNEELILAIEELRQRSTDQSWFIPVKLNECEIPDFSIGAGKTLRDLQYVEFYKDWDNGIRQVLSVVDPNSAKLNKLIRELESPSARARVRIKAADELGNMGKFAKLAIPSLLRTLGDSNETVRAISAEALGKIGAKGAMPALMKLLSEPSGYPRSKVLPALRTIIKSQTALALLETLNSVITEVIENPALRGDINLPPTSLLGAREGLKDEDKRIRRQSALVLGWYGHEEAIPALIEMLNDGDTELRELAAIILENPIETFYLDLGALEAIAPDLIELLDDEAPIVRSCVAGALVNFALHWTGDHKDLVEAIVPKLIQMLDDSEFMVRSSAAFALGQFASRRVGRPKYLKAVVPTLIKMLDDREFMVRSSAAFALGEIGDSQAVPALIKVMANESKVVLQSVAMALGKIGDERAVNVLIEALADESKWTGHYDVAEALRQIHTPEALRAVEEYEKRRRDT